MIINSIDVSKSYDCERNLSPMILIDNKRNDTLVKLRIFSLAFCPNPNNFPSLKKRLGKI